DLVSPATEIAGGELERDGAVASAPFGDAVCILALLLVGENVCMELSCNPDAGSRSRGYERNFLWPVEVSSAALVRSVAR
ncbi:MAG: hypothetical protein ACREQ5_20790, partial [Candidatus Dormibacteria bacterium]